MRLLSMDVMERLQSQSDIQGRLVRIASLLDEFDVLAFDFDEDGRTTEVSGDLANCAATSEGVEDMTL